jgi:chitin synthase
MVTLVLSCLNILSFFVVLLMHIPTHCKFVWKIIIDTPSYIAYTGAYSQTMVIHAFCNVDDVSWGTKGSSGSGGKKYEVDKVMFVCSW